MKKSKRMLRKFLLILSSALLLVSLTVGATVAYLTDTESVTNTFTVGKVGLSLTETKVNTDGTAIDGAEPVKHNGTQEFHLVPGRELIKDPTITIDEGSEDAWVVAKVVVTAKNMENVRKTIGYDNGLLGFDGILTGGVFEKTYTVDDDGTKWTSADREIVLTQEATDNSNTFYVFYQKAQVAETVLKLFEKINVPQTWTNEDLENMAELSLAVTAYAIQAEGFDTVEAAWDATKNDF